MSAPLAVLAATGSNTPSYIDDLFSVYLYQGNGSTQTITNGIDLAGKGGLVWVKQRNSTLGQTHALFDTTRGVNNELRASSAGAQFSATNSVTAFNANGFSLGADSIGDVNYSGGTNVSWTFRKAAKFFDVVTYTGNGSATRAISHSLGQVPGMIVVKRTNDTSNWCVYHRSLANTEYLYLNDTAAKASAQTFWGSTTPTASEFTVSTSGGNGTNENTVQYVAYLFAHDTTTDGLIQCGSFTSDGSGNGSVTNLPWEPQFILYKNSSSTGPWQMFDVMRGAAYGGSVKLLANTSDAESAQNYTVPTATGFSCTNGTLTASSTFIYLAIRRPNKPPTTGTQVYAAAGRTGTASVIPRWSAGFPVDMAIRQATKNVGGNNNQLMDRLRGTVTSNTNDTSAESTGATTLADFSSNTGFGSIGSVGSDSNDFAWMFRRAPGVFDVVCYTGTGANLNVTHGLGVAPEMMIIKVRSAVTNWYVYHKAVGNQSAMLLNVTNTPSGASAVNWNNTDPTASVFTVGTTAGVNTSSGTHVAYLFATKAGISYVGSYTGNGGTAGTTGTSQNLDFGFSAGARFVMIKATNATGDWFVWDSTRGIVASTDPHLSLNTTAAEVTTDDSVDPLNAGITVNQLAATDLNVTGRTYLVLAFA